MGLKPSVQGKNRIGDWRGNTIGSLRPMLVQDFRQQVTAKQPSYGLMLIPQQSSGLLVGKKQTPLEPYFPPQADYGSAPVYREHTFEFRPTGGMGESVQSSHTDRRYHYAMDCWVTGGLFGLGPKVHPIVPSSRGFVRRFIEALDASRTLALFILAGNYVLERTNDTDAGQAVSYTGASEAWDAARFQGGYPGAYDALYVAWSDGSLRELGPSGWQACTLPTGFSANFLCVLGTQMWAADSARSVIRNCQADPKVAGSWSGPIFIGNPSTQITAIRQTTNRLVIFKSDGDVFTVNGDGSCNDLFPGLEFTPDMDNARTATAWQGSLWFRTGRAFWQLDMQGGAVLTPQGPGRALGNLSEVRGPVQAFAGWNSQMAFGVVYNAATSTSYLLTYGNWEPQSGDTGTTYAFSTQWDGAIAHWTGRKATALEVSAIPSDARLYVGFEDGGYDWIKLVPYPFNPDSNAEYTDSGYIVAPLHTDMFQADIKQTIGFSVHGPSFLAGTSADIGYRLRGAAGMPSSLPVAPDVPPVLGEYLQMGKLFTFNGQRWDFDHSVAAIALEMKLTLNTSDSQYSPVLEGIGIHERLVPAFRRDFSFSVDARDRVARRDGASTRQSGRFIRDLMMQGAGAPSTLSMYFPDEEILDVAIFDYTERMVAHTAIGGQGWAVDCQATEFLVLTIYGIIGRTRGNTIGSLRGWQISQLKRF